MRSELCVVERDEQGSVYVWVQAHSFARSALMRQHGREGIVKRSVRKSDDLILEYDADGYLFGIEIRNVSEQLRDSADIVIEGQATTR